MGFVSIFGYKAILNIQSKGKQLELNQFILEFSSAVEETKQFGYVKQENFKIPKGYQAICIVTVDPATGLPLNVNAGDSPFPLVENSVNDCIKKNVFLIDEELEESFFVDNVEVSGNVGTNLLCAYIVNNRFPIRLEGMGSHTLLSTWQITEKMCSVAVNSGIFCDTIKLLPELRDICATYGIDGTRLGCP